MIKDTCIFLFLLLGYVLIYFCFKKLHNFSLTLLADFSRDLRRLIYQSHNPYKIFSANSLSFAISFFLDSSMLVERDTHL